MAKNGLIVDFSAIPNGWIVWDFGQNPLFNLWHATLVKSPDGNGEAVYAGEEDSAGEALSKCVEQIHALNNQT